MAPNVIDVNAIDGADLSALVNTNKSKFPPLATSLFDTPLATPQETINVNTQNKQKAPSISFETNRYWYWNESTYQSDSNEDEDESDEVINEVCNYENIRQLLKVENIEKRLIEACEDLKAKKSEDDIISGVVTEHDGYWYMPSRETADDENDSNEAHIELFSVKNLERGLSEDINRRRQLRKAGGTHTNSHVDNHSHSDVDHWDWHSSEAEKERAVEACRDVVIRDILKREEIRHLVSGHEIEKNLVREFEGRANDSSEMIENKHDKSSWDYYWKFDANEHDGVHHHILRHEEARRAVDVKRMESNLMEEGKSRIESKVVESCVDVDYWAWSDEHTVRADHDIESYDAYWNFEATEHGAGVDYIYRHEEARKAVHVDNMMKNLVLEAKSKIVVAVDVNPTKEVEGYWDW